MPDTHTLSTVEPSDWDLIVRDGACAISAAQLEPNDGTPEEYAAAALQAMLPRITARLVDHLTKAHRSAKTFHERAALAKATRLVTETLWDQKINTAGSPHV